MIVNSDVKSLEIHTAAFLSQDKVLMNELWGGFDLHTDNQTRFILPSRHVAKFFIFRILFGGTEFGFAKDPDFYECKFSISQWKEVIRKFYDKYQGIAEWHEKILREAKASGQLIMPHGRVYPFTRIQRRGEWVWPETEIKNYPVQGLGADLMTLFRVLVWTEIKRREIEALMVSSVHDSLVIDTPEKNVEEVLTIKQNCATIVGIEFEKRFGIEYNLPFRIECQVGKDFKNMEEV